MTTACLMFLSLPDSLDLFTSLLFNKSYLHFILQLPAFVTSTVND